MLSHPSPKNIAILGGGDGGALREVLNFHSVEEVHLVEIDEQVINVSLQYLPSLAATMANPKAVIHVADAFQWIKNHSGTTILDIVIVDLLDLTGSVNKSVFGHLFNPSLESGSFDKLEEFVKDIRTIIGEDGAMAFQLGEVPTPTACSLTNSALNQLVECAGLRRQHIFLQTLKKYFSYTHVYSVYVSRWRGLWSVVVATSSDLVEERFSRSDMAQISSDLRARMIRPNVNFGADMMASFQVQPNIWTHINNVMFHEIDERDSKDKAPMSSKKEEEHLLCPHIKQLAPNNDEYSGYIIPYRLGLSQVAQTGVGVFTLKDVKRGDVVWRFQRENFHFLTIENWLSIIEQQVRQRNWKGAPDLDALWEKAVGSGWKPDNQTAAVPGELMRLLLMRDWINDWPKAFFPEQNEDTKCQKNEERLQRQEHDEERENKVVMLYELDDAKYINHGPYGAREKNFIKSIKYQNQETAKDAVKSKVSIALKDIPACTELLENYWHHEDNLFIEGDEWKEPAWYVEVLDKYEGLKEFLRNPPYKFSATIEANVGSF